MKTNILTTMFVASFMVIAAGAAGTAHAQNGEMKRENGIFYLEVSGTPYECGLQHGEAFKSEVQKAIADYKANVAKMFGEEDAVKILDWALNKAKFKTDLGKFVPNQLEEAKGIAKGAGVTVNDILMLSMYEEVYEAGPHKIGIKPEPKKTIGHGCTSYTVLAGGKRFAGQNMDYSGNLHEKQLVTKCDYGDLKILRYDFVGSACGFGMNNHGLTIWATTLPQGKKRDDDGLGSGAIARALLECKSVDEAIAKLRSVPRFGTLSYNITDSKKGVIVEASSDEVSVREMTKKEPFLVETNHILNLKKRNDMPGLYKDGEPILGSISLTIVRKIVMENKILAKLDAMSVDGLQQMLTETPNNIYHPAFMTLLSSVVEYDGDSVTLHVSAGPEIKRGWNSYSFNK
jgi:isopenicillin-N N-acyltransferase-like protein